MNPKVIALSLIIAASTPLGAPADIRRQSEPPKKEEKTLPTLEAELKVAKEELAKMLIRFTEAHPIVIAQRRKIADLERQIAAKKKPNSEGTGDGVRPKRVTWATCRAELLQDSVAPLDDRPLDARSASTFVAKS